MLKMKLTDGEKILLIRKRKELNQSEFGSSYGLNQNMVSMIERDKLSFPGPVPDTDVKHDGEYCRILRQRLNIFLESMCEILNVSKPTLIKMEKTGENCKEYLEILENMK